jgi:hypothetical protein
VSLICQRGTNKLCLNANALQLKRSCNTRQAQAARADVVANQYVAGDGLNVVGINLPHIVFQPIEGQVQYKTTDITPRLLVSLHTRYFGRACCKSYQKFC